MQDAVERAVGPTTRLCPRCGSTGHGRPRAADGVPLSLARADGVVLLARADAPVGVDVEAVTGPDDDAALRAWTRAEAVLKAHGTGLARDPGTLGTDEQEGVRTAAVPLPAGWVATVAVLDPVGMAPGRHGPALEVRLRDVPAAPAAAARTARDPAAR